MGDATCSYDRCPDPVFARKWCQKHYARWRAHGDPSISKLHRVPMEERFWIWVDVCGPDECWPWKGYVGKRGYGQFCINRHRSRQAHRMAYALTYDGVPEDLELDHLCHNRDLACPGGYGCHHRRCCNPAHLEPVTGLENIQRRDRRRQARTGMRVAVRVPALPCIVAVETPTLF